METGINSREFVSWFCLKLFGFICILQILCEPATLGSVFEAWLKTKGFPQDQRLAPVVSRDFSSPWAPEDLRLRTPPLSKCLRLLPLSALKSRRRQKIIGC